jgi:antitoxin component HigA of HigAB toxin-antitoxin module
MSLGFLYQIEKEFRDDRSKLIEEYEKSKEDLANEIMRTSYSDILNLRKLYNLEKVQNLAKQIEEFDIKLNTTELIKEVNQSIV